MLAPGVTLSSSEVFIFVPYIPLNGIDRNTVFPAAIPPDAAAAHKGPKPRDYPDAIH
jgi:hypothetical protein